MWPSSGAEAAAAAAATPPPLFAENADPGWFMGGDYTEWLYQESPWSYDIAMENPMVSNLGPAFSLSEQLLMLDAHGLAVCWLCCPPAAEVRGVPHPWQDPSHAPYLHGTSLGMKDPIPMTFQMQARGPAAALH